MSVASQGAEGWSGRGFVALAPAGTERAARFTLACFFALVGGHAAAAAPPAGCRRAVRDCACAVGIWRADRAGVPTGVDAGGITGTAATCRRAGRWCTDTRTWTPSLSDSSCCGAGRAEGIESASRVRSSVCASLVS